MPLPAVTGSGGPLVAVVPIDDGPAGDYSKSFVFKVAGDSSTTNVPLVKDTYRVYNWQPTFIPAQASTYDGDDALDLSAKNAAGWTDYGTTTTVTAKNLSIKGASAYAVGRGIVITKANDAVSDNWTLAASVADGGATNLTTNVVSVYMGTTVDTGGGVLLTHK